MRRSHWSDERVIRASLADKALFNLICERHYDSVFAYVARRHGRDRASDVVQEVFIKALRARGRFDHSREDCLPWLYGIARNTIGDAIRKSHRVTRNYLAHSGLRGTQTDHADDAASKVDAQKKADRINEALSELGPMDREALLLYSLEELSYSEIADVLSIPLGTVKSRLNRARSKFRAEFGEPDPPSEQSTGQKPL